MTAWSYNWAGGVRALVEPLGIRTDIKPKRLQDPSLNSFTAKQRVRQLVDDWLEYSLNERDDPKR